MKPTTLSTLLGIIEELDVYYPFTDKDGGITEMSKLPNEVRQVSDN